MSVTPIFESVAVGPATVATPATGEDCKATATDDGATLRVTVRGAAGVALATAMLAALMPASDAAAPPPGQ